jgi:hypothetical protein
MIVASSRFTTLASAGWLSAIVTPSNGEASAAGAWVTSAEPLPPSVGANVLASTSTTAGAGAPSAGREVVITDPWSVACSVSTTPSATRTARTGPNAGRSRLPTRAAARSRPFGVAGARTARPASRAAAIAAPA